MLARLSRVTKKSVASRLWPGCSRRTAVSAAKREGDISSVFVSLSGAQAEPLPSHFAELKHRLISGHQDALRASWDRLLAQISEEVEEVHATGPATIPQLSYENLHNVPEYLVNDIRKKGAAVIRGVVSEAEALEYKADILRYVKDNPHTKAFPANDPQVYELYWSPSQVRARAHPNLLQTQRFLMNLWHAADENAAISTKIPLSYADRVRIRNPGDTGFSLGPHVDGGGVERWEEHGYGLGGVYEKIWRGQWEEYDPWESSCRLPVQQDLYNGAGPREGTLLVNPLLSRATAYFLLRPFFSPQRTSPLAGPEAFLASDNWKLDSAQTTSLQGASPSHCQELNDALHPHLQLARSMIHIPTVHPGDYVVWHCDTIHAVDSIHEGTSDASVMYIGVCPLTKGNARYLARQRAAMIEGIPPPDFPGGIGESRHVGRADEKFIRDLHWADAGGRRGEGRGVRNGEEGQRAMGFQPFSVESSLSAAASHSSSGQSATTGRQTSEASGSGVGAGEEQAVQEANGILFG